MHTPVLPQEVLTELQPEKGGAFLDATLGLGGHSLLILGAAKKAGKQIHLYGIDQDDDALELATQNLESFGDAVQLIPGNFGNLKALVQEFAIPPLQGILMDIGVSSMQIDTPERGFSFRFDGPLDMRMDQNETVSAATIVNTWMEIQLANLFWQYGEERLSRRIARVIVERRKKKRFETTLDLAEVVASCYPPKARHQHPHPATRVFQALRIEVNRELEVLERGLLAGYEALAPGGRIAVISFHSLEDRVVKRMFRDWAVAEWGTVLTKKPITASAEEQAENPRSRSAKLRVFQKR